MNGFVFVLLLLLFLVIIAIGIVMIVMKNKFVNSTGVLVAGIVLLVLGVIGLLATIFWYSYDKRQQKLTVIRPKTTTVVVEREPEVEVDYLGPASVGLQSERTIAIR